MEHPTVLWFGDTQCTDLSQVGGKGANLGRLTNNGFVVPPGFVIGTTAYATHIESNDGLRKKIADALENINYDNADELEACVLKIRNWIVEAPIPASLASDISSAYVKLGADLYVAVRSSGTAEDLEGASFAGLHDTYLDIRGNDNLLDAVKRCWASMWTARAASYRKTQGFDNFKSSIAVVVQTMVESEVSGVMFTANPINSVTDETIINASWGLGEAVVSGIVTPDEYIVSSRNLQILQQTLGSKEHKIVRNMEFGNGTLHLPVPADERAKFTFTSEQVATLADIGRKIQDAYEGFPQDIEWAYSQGKFYILQARPITGVEFSWDAIVTASVQGNDDAVPYDNVWSRNFPEEMWTGAISPLMFSWRGWGNTQCHSIGVQTFGYPELDYTTQRLWKYHKGTVYYNVKADFDLITTAIPPQLRPGMLHKLPTAMREKAQNAPFDWGRYIESFLQVEANRPDMGYNWWRAIRDDFIENKEYRAATRPLSPSELQAMSDEDLKQHIVTVLRLEISSYDPPWNGLLWYMREALGWVNWMIQSWYDGGRPNVMMDLMTGTRHPNVTSEENFSIWRLADMIYRSPELKTLYEMHPDASFFSYLDRCIDGPKFRDLYADYLRLCGHRGHADRDIYYPRRLDDPVIDLRMFKGLFGTPDPRIQEQQIRQRLEGTIQHVYENLAGQAYGIFKAKLFKFLIDFAHYSIEFRDNEREVMDWSTYGIKLSYQEVGRRCLERGYLDTPRDFYFLTMQELYDVLDGKANMKLAKAKIAARAKNFDLVDSKKVHPAPYLQCDRPAPIDQPELSGDGVLRGKITSVGKVTGTARVVHELSQIGRVQQGEILIVHATDPGWTPVFMLIKGIVLETGGLISHGALLAREYGLPGVQIEGALRLIPDGAMVTVDGDNGMVVIHDEPSDASFDEDEEALAETE